MGPYVKHNAFQSDVFYTEGRKPISFFQLWCLLGAGGVQVRWRGAWSSRCWSRGQPRGALPPHEEWSAVVPVRGR